MNEDAKKPHSLLWPKKFALKKAAADFFKSDKKVRILILCVIAGMLLLLLSECSIKPKSPATVKTDTAGEADSFDKNAQYTQNLEDKIKNMVSQIAGAGKTEVVITLEKGEEYVYAESEKTNTDYQKDFDGSTAKKVQGKDNTERDYILIEDENGNKKALIRTKLEPTVKGAVIICEGGGSTAVEQKVTECVATALNISWDKVSVCKKIK